VSATTADGEVMAVRHRELRVDGVQFHPESVLTPLGPELAKNFLEAAGTSASWDDAGGAGPEGTVPTSTGPESTVAAGVSGGGAGLLPAGAAVRQGGEA